MIEIEPAGPDSPGAFAAAYEERVLRRIPLEILVLGAAAGAVLAAVFSPLSGLFAFLGAAASSLSFLWLRRALARVLAPGLSKRHAIRTGALLYAGRILLILALFSLIIVAYPSKLLAFAAGFSAVILVFLAETALALARMKSWKD